MSGYPDSTVMEFGGDDFDDDALAREDLAGARVLCLNCTSVTDAGIEFLRRARDLEELQIGATQISDRAMSILCDLPKLESLLLDDAPHITDVGIANLERAPDLADLSLAGTQLTDKGTACLSGLKKLETISLNNTEVTDEGIRVLESLPLLRTVSLKRTKVAGSRLGRLPNNEHFQLILDGSPITDEAIAHLAAGLTKLKRLSLSETAITDRALKSLTGLQSLNAVVLRNTNVTDEGVATLRTLPELEAVDLRGTNVSIPCIAALRAANRRLRIVMPSDT